MRQATFINEITVVDPETNAPVQVSMFKHENGGIFGIDSSFLEQMFDDEETPTVYDMFGARTIVKLNS
jgi:hypothetical protein